MYDTLLFDLDGTIVDSSRGITNCAIYALEKFGITVTDRRELYRFIGPPLVDSFRDFYGFSDENAEAAVAFYRERYREAGMYENDVYDGIPELLEALRARGKRIFLATSKPEEFAKKILEYLKLDEYFDLIAGATFDRSRGTKESVIRYALAEGGLATDGSIVMIGDRLHDVEGAQAVGIDSIGVLWGFGSREELESEGATHIAEAAEDILALV